MLSSAVNNCWPTTVTCWLHWASSSVYSTMSDWAWRCATRGSVCVSWHLFTSIYLTLCFMDLRVSLKMKKNFVPNSGLRKFRHGTSTVAERDINKWQSSELLYWQHLATTAVVAKWHQQSPTIVTCWSHSASSTMCVRLRRAGPSATAIVLHLSQSPLVRFVVGLLYNKLHNKSNQWSFSLRPDNAKNTQCLSDILLVQCLPPPSVYVCYNQFHFYVSLFQTIPAWVVTDAKK